MFVINDLGQPTGVPLPNWRPPAAPRPGPLVGAVCRLEPVNPAVHAEGLHQENARDPSGAMWTYLPYGPFTDAPSYREWMVRSCLGSDPLFFAILDQATGRPVGLAAYLRIDPANGVIEVGHLAYSPRMQRSRSATEAMYLMMRSAFDGGYRRYEWKCDALNERSRAAAERLGFSYEGTFRQAVVTKGRNRDTAWYSILDREWPTVRAALEQWLAPGNFEPGGEQRSSLSMFMKARADMRG